MDVSQVRVDLLAEQQALDDLMTGLTPDQWALPTPSPGWSVADQIAHLAYFDHAAATALTDPERFQTMVTELSTVAVDSTSVDESTLAAFRAMTPNELLVAWRHNRTLLADAANQLDDDSRVEWYGPSMSSKSFLTARLMEAWAHGQDIVDAVSTDRPATDRLRHIAQLGFITRAWSYTNRGLDIPGEPVRVELTAPSGDTWTFGPDDAAESVFGPAEGFCLVVTQRRHLEDTDLVTTPVARDWMLMAQAFAGPATDGPAAGSRP